ncbi:hypothetical protein FNV43_RR19252 [Rhamnella rubrinervis]|uniref:ADP-ribosyl cyclase/cyclic ADP-ribose hydrolase n=1 Tax=Rhamnella rubrinervis TaxID=2594499 RepID=A0A8K0GWR7_9ROSA|nr:hypothetical protein FNV43_RR19252 [Rhamnella rubrinervis]
MAGQSRSTNIPYVKFKHKDFPTYESHLSSYSTSSSTSSSLSKPKFKYDVFLSFRGEDTRKNFTDHLYAALNGNGITTFKDDGELDRGKDISPELLQAIEASRNSVIPIFYCVDPSVVRNQTDSYAIAFSEHEEKYNEGQQMEKVKRWRFALTAVANLSGWHLKDGRESEFIQNIVQGLSCGLNDTPEGIISSPNDRSDYISGEIDDPNTITCKTTIARVVYQKLFDQFDVCCFLGNVRERSAQCSLVDLQKHLLCELMREKLMFVIDVHHGIGLLSKMFRDKSVLIVLDDLGELDQLEALAGEAHWFGVGSRIIITTRDMNLLTLKGVKMVYTCKGLSHDEATQLFSIFAFGQIHPAIGYEEVSNHVVEYANGNPFALKAMAGIGIKVLIDKSLVTISNNILWMHGLVENMGRTIVRRECKHHCGKRSRLWDHCDINAIIRKNLGTGAIKAIVCDPPKTETDQYRNRRAFSGMYNLELLNICSNVHLSQGLDYLPNKLKLFKWRRYPLKSLPSNFYPSELFELNMCHSQLVQRWSGEKIFKNLKFIKLSRSRNLIKTPDFTGVPNLESLVLEGCTKLVEVHPSIGILKRLRLMNLKDCFSLRSFPKTISMESLQICILSGCSKLDKFSDVEGNMLCLSQLYLDGVATENLPSSTSEQLMGRPSFASLLFSIPNIKKLSLRNCDLPEGALPTDIGCLTSLELLDVGGNNFSSLPASISQLDRLRFLGLPNCNLLQSLMELPSSLEYVEARDCSSLMTTVSNPSKVRTSTDLVLSFINCYRLKQNQGRKSMIITWLKMYLQSLVKSQNQELSNLSGRFDIIIPGTRIPEWFRHQNMGPSVRIHLLPKWNKNNWVGFVFFVVLGVHDEIVDVEHDSQIQESESSHEIACQLYTNDGSISTGFGFKISSVTYFKPDHVWVPLDEILEKAVENFVEDIQKKVATAPTSCGVTHAWNNGYVLERRVDTLELHVKSFQKEE